MRNGSAHDNCPGARINRGAGLLGRVHAALADDGKAGKFLGRLAQERQIGTVGHGAIDSGNTMRKRGGHQVKAHVDSTTNILDGGTVGHQEHALLVQRTEGVLDGLAIGTWAISGINCHDVGTSGNAGASMTQRRRDVDALVSIFPQADDGNLAAALNGGDVGKTLAANSGGATMVSGVRSGSPI